MPFSGQTLSPDVRTTKLVQLAVQHMSRIHTLRIIFGHLNLIDALLRCFFGRSRQYNTPIRRLWLENCRISSGCCTKIPDHPLGLPLQLDFTGLESVRFRRMPLRPGRSPSEEVPRLQLVHARGGHTFEKLQDGAGGQQATTVNSLRKELRWVTLGNDPSGDEDVEK